MTPPLEDDRGASLAMQRALKHATHPDQKSPFFVGNIKAHATTPRKAILLRSVPYTLLTLSRLQRYDVSATSGPYVDTEVKWAGEP